MTVERAYFSCSVVWILLAVALAGPSGCKGPGPKEQKRPKRPGAGAMAIRIESEAFGPNQAIPRKYTGEGQDISPPLRWSNLPEGTKQLALIVDDPDAPRPEPWVHWLLYNIPPNVDSLPEAIETEKTLKTPAGAMQGKSSWGRIGYGGPMPPPGHGVHHYHFKLYALDAELELKPGLEKDGLLMVITGHILGEGELVGTYQR